MERRLSRLLQATNVYSIVTGITFAAFLFLVLYPIGSMTLWTFFQDGQLNIAAPLSVLLDEATLILLRNTAILVFGGTFLSLVIGSLMAWIQERTDANMGRIGAAVPVIPLLLPAIALPIGWVFIADPRVGFLNGFLASLFGPQAKIFNIYSWAGLLWAYTIQGVPYVYLVVAAALKNIDPSMEEASLISGARLTKTLHRVTFPAVRPALLAAALLTVIVNLGNYALPAIIATRAGIDVLSLNMVRMLTLEYPPKIAEAQVLGVLTLLIVAAIWLVQRHVAGSRNFSSVGGRASGQSKLELGAWRRPAKSLMVFYVCCASLFPLIALVIVALQPFWTPRIDPAHFTLANFHRVLFEERLPVAAILNSVTVSAIAASVAMVVAMLSAIYVATKPGVLSAFTDGVLKLPLAVPNLVTSLSFLVIFAGAPFNLAGTTTLLVLAYLVMYIPTGSIAASSAVTQIGKEVREASYISGAREGRTVLRIMLPLALPGFIGGWMMVFVTMMGDISGASLLAGIGNPVIGFVILSIWESGSFGLLAAYAVLICLFVTAVILSMLGIIRLLQSKNNR